MQCVYYLPTSSFEYNLFALQDLMGESDSSAAPLVVIVVPALPKGAAVELHVTAVQDEPTERTSYRMTTKMACGAVECHAIMSANRCSASLSLCLAVPADDPEVTAVKYVTEALGATLKKAMKKMGTELMPLCARVFYKYTHSVAWSIVQGMSLDMCLTQDTTHELYSSNIYAL